MIAGIDHSQGVHEEKHENSDEDEFKEKHVEMFHHPLRGTIVPLAYLVHEITKTHKLSPYDNHSTQLFRPRNSYCF